MAAAVRYSREEGKMQLVASLWPPSRRNNVSDSLYEVHVDPQVAVPTVLATDPKLPAEKVD